MFHLAQRKDYMMVETRPLGPGLWCFVCLVWCWVSLFLSPPSDCSSLPSTMTWAPCPHGVRTRGKKQPNRGSDSILVLTTGTLRAQHLQASSNSRGGGPTQRQLSKLRVQPPSTVMCCMAIQLSQQQLTQHDFDHECCTRPMLRIQPIPPHQWGKVAR